MKTLINGGLKMLRKSIGIILFMASFAVFALQQESDFKAPEGPGVYIISPIDGSTVAQTFTVKFGLHGMGIAPSGIDRENTGHHHLLIDTSVLPDMAKPLQATDKIIHFGGGQTETKVTLSPGKHTLQLLLGNYMHVPHDQPLMSQKITVLVE
ncbi:MAG: hypothetical protein ACJAU1_000549 [Psychromonas sp.]